MEKDKDKEIAQLQAEISGWIDFAAHESRGVDYYRGLLEKIGQFFGEEAYICDDGSIQEDILIAKVPELVEKLFEKKSEQEFKVENNSKKLLEI
jgi:hypothetical protein